MQRASGYQAFVGIHKFIWPKIKESDEVLASDILCIIPHGPQPSGTKSRVVYEFMNTQDIQQLFDNDAHSS